MIKMIRIKEKIAIEQILLVSILIGIVPCHGTTDDKNSSVGEGRFMFMGKPIMYFPPTAPTRHQLISGIGIPLGTPESITTGWVLKAQYFLPTKIQDYQPVLWEGWNETRRSLEKREVDSTTPGEQHYEKYTATDIKVDMEPLPEDKLNSVDSDDDDDFDDGDDDYWLDEEDIKNYQEASEKLPPVEIDPEVRDGYNAERSRWTTYKSLEHIGEAYGSGGRGCVLRSICEAAAAEFTHTGGVFAELLHIVFTPSTTTEPLSDHSDNEYYRAEQLGREGAPCQQVFRDCKNSILDVFTGVHDPTTNELTHAHEKIMKSFMK